MLALIVFHLISMIILFGFVMAFLTRANLRRNLSKKEIAKLYMMSFFFSLPGIMAALPLSDAFSFGEYGWKLHHGEIASIENKWFLRLNELIVTMNGDVRRANRAEERVPVAGNFISIWENVLR